MPRLWQIGLFIVCIAQTWATSMEMEISMEAAFQGRCGQGSPCEQLCYELHDGMYECDCTEGYELNKNGYSCEEINSTMLASEAELESRTASIEDVLYQKGASFSAKLDDTNGHVMDNSIDSNDILPSAPSSSDPTHRLTKSASLVTRNREYLDSLATIANGAAELDPASSASNDMSIFDDVNNNRLNLPVINDRFTVRQAPQFPPTQDNGLKADTTMSYSTTLSPTHTFNASASSATPCTLECGPEGLCDASAGGRARCMCPFERTGDKCTEGLQVNVARFSRRSWLAFPAFRGAYKHVQIHIEFRPEGFDGILLLSGERDDLTGDFVALLLHQGFVEFWFDCGSGTGKVRSEEPVLLNQWNTVTIYRHRWDAWLVLNQGNRIQGRSKGLFSRITFREPVFLGGTGNITAAKVLPVFDGFVGCIRKFIANEHEYNFKGAPYGDVAQGFDILECVTDVCSRYPCKHAGKCLLSDQGAICLCPLGFGGDLCEMRLDLQVPSFNGSSYLRFAPLGDSALIWLELKITIKPNQEDGLILYSGHHEYGDYISMCLNMGYVEFSFDLGSGPAIVRSETPLQMGQWHTIKLSRTARLAVLKIDQMPEIMTVSSNGFWHLSLPHSLFLGGVNNDQTLPQSLRERGSFNGCIQTVEVNGRSLSIISEALGGSNIDNCPHACLAKPCGPLAKCVPSLESYECKCNPQNEQCNKAEEIPINFIEHRMQRTLGSVPNVVEEDSEDEEEEEAYGEGDLSNNVSTSTTTTTTTTTKAPPATTTTQEISREERQTTMIDYEEERDSAPFALPMKSGTAKEALVVAAVEDVTEDYYYAAYDEDGVDLQKTSESSLGSILNVQAKESISETTRWSSITRDGEKVSLSEAESPEDNENPIESDKANAIWEDEEGEADGVVSKKESAVGNSDGRDEEDYDDDDDYFEMEDNLRTTTAEDDEEDGEEMDDDLEDFLRPFKIVLPPWREDKTSVNDKDDVSPFDNPNAAAPFLKSHEFLVDMDRMMKGKEEPSVGQRRAEHLTTSTSVRPEPTTRKSYPNKRRGSCFTGTDSFFHYSDGDTMRRMSKYKLDINLRFKSHSSQGLLLWTGRHAARINDNFLLLGIENGFLHMRYNLGGGHEIDLTFNGTRVSDGLWHRVRIFRSLREGSLEVDGSEPVIERSPAKLRSFNTDAGLYIGGMPKPEYYTRQRYRTGIIGCISEVVLAAELRLNLDSSVLGTAHNVDHGGVV